MRKILKTIAKWIGLFIGVVFLIIALALFVYIELDFPHPKLAKLGEKYGSKWLKKELKLGRLDGPLFGKVVVYDLRVGNGPSIEKDGQMVYIKKLTLNYSLLGTILSGGDFLANITKLKIENLDLLVVKKENNWWNVAHFFPKGKPGGKPKRMFMKVILKDAGGRFVDYAGFGKKKLTSEFKMFYRNLNGIVNLNTYPKLQFRVSCDGGRYGDLIQISSSGYYNFWSKKYEINNDVRNVHMPRWADYGLPWENVEIRKGQANFLAKLYKAKDAITGKKRFHYLIDFNINNSEIKMPQFDDPVGKICGRGVFGRGGVTFYGFNANLNEIPFDVNGSVIRYKNYDLSFKTEKSNLIKAQRLFKFLRDWETQGGFQAEFEITGPVKQPKFEGNIEVFKGSAKGVPIQNLKSKFLYENKKVDFEISEALIYGGKSRAHGIIDLGRGKEFNVDFDVNGASFGQVVGQQKYARGKIDSKILVQGHPKDYVIKVNILSQGATFLNQKLNSAGLNFQYRNNKFSLQETPIIINNNHLYLKGWVDSQRKFNFTLSCKGFPLYKLRWSKNNLSGSLDLNGSISGISGLKRKGHKTRDLKGDFDIVLDKLVIDNQKFDSIKTNFKVKGNVFEINNFIARSGEGYINANGLFDKYGLISIKAQTTDLNLEKLSAVKKYLPKGSKELGGLTKAELDIKRNKKFNPRVGTKSASGFDITGKVYLTKAFFFNQPFEEVRMGFYWDGNEIHSKETMLKTQSSVVYLDGEIGKNGKLNLNIKENTLLDLSEFNPFIAKVGELGGIARFTGNLRGNLKKPAFFGHGEVRKFSYNDLNIDYFSGRLAWHDQILNLGEFKVKHKNDNYEVNGNINFNKYFKTKKTFSDNYELDISVDKSDIRTLSELIKNMMEIGKKRKMKETLARRYLKYYMKVRTPNSNPNLLLYKAGGEKHVVEFLNNLQKEVSKLRKPRVSELTKKLGGLLWAKVNIRQKGKAKSIKVSGKITEGKYNFIKFKEMTFKAKSSSPLVDIELDIKQGNMGGADFGQLKTKGKFDDKSGYFVIKEFLISRKNILSKNIISGKIPLKAFWDKKYSSKPLWLKVDLKGNDIGIIPILGNFIEEIENEGQVNIEIKGSLPKPIISAKVFDIKNARLKLPQFPSFFNISNADLSLHKNQFIIKALKLKWVGKETKKKVNNFEIDGKVGIKYFNLLSFGKAVLDLDLKLKETLLSLDIDMLDGKIRLGNLYLKGPMTFALSKIEKQKLKQRVNKESEIGPVLAGDVNVIEGKIGVPKGAGKGKKIKNTMVYKLNCSIARDLRIKGSAISSFVGSFDLELEETKNPILISGTNNNMRMKGKIVFSSGKIGMLNKKFYILKPEQQRKYFTPYVEKIKDNTIEFGYEEAGEKKQKLEPVAYIVAETILHVLEEGGEGATLNYVENAFLIICSGSIYNRSSISFERYSLEDKSDPELQGHPYLMSDIDEERLTELFGYLLPDLINPEYYSGTVKTSTEDQSFVASLTESQINNLFSEGFLDPIGRKLQRSLGLYDFKLDYNLGESLTEAVGGSKKTSEKGLGIEIAQKFLFNRMFVRVKTRVQGATDIEFTEYELRYLITKWLFLGYENEQEDEDDPLRGYFSLEASYAF